MDNKAKVETWIKELENRIKNSSLLDFNQSKKNSLHIVNENYDALFQTMVEGINIPIVSFSNQLLNLHTEIKKYEDAHPNQCFIYTSLSDENINKVVGLIKDDSEKHYQSDSVFTSFASFGLLEYFDKDSFNPLAKSSPLVFVPVTISFNETKSEYSVQSINSEIFLNDSLIDKVLKERRIDISYPIDSHFSLIEYLSYVAVKVRPLRWSVNNGCFLANYNISRISQIKDITKSFDTISNCNLVKNISYFNSEFYRLHTSTSTRFSNKFLSLLEVDANEYSLMKQIASRDDLFIQCNSQDNINHIVENTIASFLLNNQKILIAYNSQDTVKDLLTNLENSWLKPYIVNLDESKINKKEFIKDLMNYDKYTVQPGILDAISLEEKIGAYFESKNNFKKVLNDLRKNNKPLNISINKAIENYYKFADYPDIDIEINKILQVDQQRLDNYILSISSFKKSVLNLKFPLKEHPFYGFDRSVMKKEDYSPLFESAITLSESLKRTRFTIKAFNRKYNLPLATTLKELKAVLNILTFVSKYNNYPKYWFKDTHFVEDVNEIKSIQQDIVTKNNEKSIIIAKYSERIFLLDLSPFEHALNGTPLTKKEIRKFNSFFGKKSQLNSEQIKQILNSIDLLKEHEKNIESRVNNLDESLRDYVNQSDLSLLEEAINDFNFYYTSIKYLTQNHIKTDSIDLDAITHESVFKTIMAQRQKLQLSFNSILQKTNIIQNYFNKDDIDFATLSLSEFENKVTLIGKNFSTINDYLDFFINHRQMNRLIAHLGDELIKQQPQDFEKIFLRKFYKNYALTMMSINPLFKDYSYEKLMKSLDDFATLNANRTNIITSIIKNNYINFFHLNLNNIKRYEYPALEGYLKDKILPLSAITNSAKESVFNMKPCVFAPISRISSLLSNEKYKYDAVLFIADNKLQVKDVLSSIGKGEEIIVISTNLISKSNQTEFIDDSDTENLLVAAKSSLVNAKYISSSYEDRSLQLNLFDASLKTYLVNKLIEHGLEAIKDCTTEKGTIDILTRVPDSKTATAIVVDHLSYLSPESALKSLKANNAALSALDYSYFHIVSSCFFVDEDKTIEQIIKFVTSHANRVSHKIQVKRPLMEVLFPLYHSPLEVFYLIENKEELSNKDIALDIIEKVAPVKANEITSLFSTDISEDIKSLVSENKIVLKDDFIFIPDEKIDFRIVQKNGKIQRKLESICKEELQFGIQKLINNQSSMSEEMLVKLILVYLGYQKMNAALARVILENVDDLKNKKIIDEKDHLLFKAHIK